MSEPPRMPPRKQWTIAGDRLVRNLFLASIAMFMAGVVAQTILEWWP